MDIGSMKCNIHSICWYKFSQYELSIRVEIDKLCDEIYCEGEIEMNYCGIRKDQSCCIIDVNEFF